MGFDMIVGFGRHALTFVGGWMVAKGFFDEATMNEVVGGVMTIVGVVWSMIQKYQASKKAA